MRDTSDQEDTEMGGLRRRVALGLGAAAAGSLALVAGPLTGTASAEEICTIQLGISDPGACLGINSSFGGTLVVLVGSQSLDTTVLAGATCTTGPDATFVVYSFPGTLLGSPLAPVALDSTVPC